MYILASTQKLGPFKFLLRDESYCSEFHMLSIMVLFPRLTWIKALCHANSVCVEKYTWVTIRLVSCELYVFTNWRCLKMFFDALSFLSVCMYVCIVAQYIIVTALVSVEKLGSVEDAPLCSAPVGKHPRILFVLGWWSFVLFVPSNYKPRIHRLLGLLWFVMRSLCYSKYCVGLSFKGSLGVQWPTAEKQLSFSTISGVRILRQW